MKFSITKGIGVRGVHSSSSYMIDQIYGIDPLIAYAMMQAGNPDFSAGIIAKNKLLTTEVLEVQAKIKGEYNANTKDKEDL